MLKFSTRHLARASDHTILPIQGGCVNLTFYSTGDMSAPLRRSIHYPWRRSNIYHRERGNVIHTDDSIPNLRYRREICDKPPWWFSIWLVAISTAIILNFAWGCDLFGPLVLMDKSYISHSIWLIFRALKEALCIRELSLKYFRLAMRGVTEHFDSSKIMLWSMTFEIN